jgi:ABC-type transporter Mla subunit MlaD
VQAAQGVDQVLSAFDAPTRDDLKRFLNGVADALNDRGDDLNAALGNGPVAISDLNALVTILDRQRPALKSLVRDTSQALGAVASRSGDLQSLATAGNDVLSATASRNRALTATVRALPAFLRQLRSTLGDVEGAAADAAPTLHALRPVAPLVKRAIEGSNRLLPQVVPLVRQLGPVIDSAQDGLPAATRVIDAAKPFTGVVNPIATGLSPLFSFLLPVSDLLDAYKNEVVTSFANIGASLQATAPSSTGSAHYLRALIPLSNEAVVGYAQRPGTNRHNPYIAPGGLNSLASGLKSYDCRNTSNPTPLPALGTGAPPCATQSPWNFRGITASFPHIDG